MNEMISEVFKLLGVEPNERFRIRDAGGNVSVYLYFFDERLNLRYAKNGWLSTNHLVALLNGEDSIIKHKNMKKLRDWTPEDLKAYTRACSGCVGCPFRGITCNVELDECWIKHKDIFSDKFLDKEVEVPEVNYDTKSNEF